MGLIRRINSWERKFAWSLFGVLVSLVLGVPPLYQTYFAENKPTLAFEVLSSAPVLDVRENVPLLEILYDKRDLAKSNLSLSVIAVRVANRGNGDLLKTHYDESVPLGVITASSEIVQAELLAASNDYLSERVVPELSSKTQAVFGAVILEPGEWFDIKLLLIHSHGAQPLIEATGKIAGQDRIRIADSTLIQSNESVLDSVFDAPFLVHVTRAGYYTALALSLFLAVSGSLLYLIDSFRRRKRRRQAEQFVLFSGLAQAEAARFIIEKYTSGGVGELGRMYRILRSGDALDRLMKALVGDSAGQCRPSVLTSDMATILLLPTDQDETFPQASVFGLLNGMVEYKLIALRGSDWVANEHILDFLGKLLAFVSPRRS